MRSITRLLTGSFGRFLASGGFNTLATYLLYLALLPWLKYRVSYTIAYATGIGLAYLMNRYLVFRRPGGRAGPLLVALIYGGQYLFSLALVVVWVRWLRGPVALAPLFAVAVTLPLTYLLNRRVFSESAPQDGSRKAPRLRAALPAPATVRLWALRAAISLLVALPLLSLALNAVGWLRFGVDLPFFDDWRSYDAGEIDSFDPRYLFRPTNDTMTPIGFALDAVAQRWLDGNSVAYQFLSMLIVLGGLLLLQWKLLRTALRDRMRAAVCFVFCLLMLQPGSYWGRENLAYEQALPLIFILWAVWLGVRRPVTAFWNLALVFLLGLLSGFSYISGAFGALAAGIGMVVAAQLSPQRRHGNAVFWSGLALSAAGAVSSVIQAVYAILPAKGATHDDRPLGLPIEPEFWFFFLGKVGRSLLLAADLPALSMALVLVVCAGLLLVAALIVRAVRREPAAADSALQNTSAIFAAVSGMVLVYLLLVSAGRLHFRPVQVGAGPDIFAFAFDRFHFFWATLLWPWMIAGAIVLYDRSALSSEARKASAGVAGVVLAVCVGAMIGRGALDHLDSHRTQASYRKGTVDCLMSQLQKGEGIRCPEFMQPDLTPAYIYARSIGASFVRYFPVLPVEPGADSPRALFRLSRDAQRGQWSGVRPGSGWTFQTTEDAQITIDIGHAETMARCVMVDVTAILRPSASGPAKVYYRALGERTFSELSSMTAQVTAADAPAVVRFRIEHPFGFESTMRFDPVAGKQDFELPELEVRCRLRSRLNTLAPFYQIIDGTSPGELQRMVPVGDVGGHLRAGDDPRILFHTRHRIEMSSCRLLEVRPIYTVDRDDRGQLYFRPRGAPAFSEANSLVLPIAAGAQPQPHAFVVESTTGFEDDLRFDPVMQPQDMRFVDIGVKCLRRVDVSQYRP